AWLYRAQIYFKMSQNKEKYKEITKEPMVETLESFIKAKKYDKKNRKAKEIKRGLRAAKGRLMKAGIKDYRKKNYKKALKSFEKSLEGSKALGSPDTTIFYNAGLAAEKLGKTEKAIKYYKKSAEYDYRGPLCYNLIYGLYARNEQPKKAFKALKKGRKKYPENTKLIEYETNFYIRNKQYKKAEKSLKNAIEKAPQNAQLYYNLGTIYDNFMQDVSKDSTEKKNELFEKARKNYRYAINMDDEYANAYYNMGALYFNRGSDLMKKVNKIEDDEKYEKERKKIVKNYWEKAKPYLEKAHKLDPSDKEAVKSLMRLYANTNEDKKYKEMKKKLNK
ncbi:MAG: tetratricopeptide repeat protein, partial [Flavobacteriales bacterium]